MIQYLNQHLIYENPRPHVHSRHGYFPGLVRLPLGELLCTFVMAEAFEAPNGTTWITRSADGGRTWQLQGPLYDKSVLGFETTDAFKVTLLRSGSMVAMGYRFHRHALEQAIAIPETGGIQPGDDIISFSHDLGRSWTVPAVIKRSRPELLEISGPCLETASGGVLAVSAPYRMPDGSNPSGQVGILLRSCDQGATWDDRTLFFRAPAGDMTPLESRLCEMEAGRLVAMTWAYDYSTDQHRANHVVVSRDNGHTLVRADRHRAPRPGVGHPCIGRRHARHDSRASGSRVRAVRADRGFCRRPLACDRREDDLKWGAVRPIRCIAANG